jgi:hypothetical protein
MEGSSGIGSSPSGSAIPSLSKPWKEYKFARFYRHWEYMFLLAGNIMPGAEKLRGELLFPEEKWLVFFWPKGEKTVFLRETNVLLGVFFVPGIIFFSLKDTFSCCFILWPTISLYIWIGSVSYFPYRFH